MVRVLLFVDAKNRVEYENEIVFENVEGESSTDVAQARANAQGKAWNMMRDVIVRYTSTFKNIAVLTVAGTSMDNGAMKGKTRDGLWNLCKDEIELLQEELSKRSDGLKANHEKAANNKDIEEFLSFVVLDEKLNGPFVTHDGKVPREELQKKIAVA